MIKFAALSIVGAMAFATAAKVDAPVRPVTLPTIDFPIHPAVADPNAKGMETIVVVYSPLESTKISKLVGFGMAYHMAIVYTDRAGRSFGASSGPSNAVNPQTPANAAESIVDLANRQPSSFGTLISDPLNDHAFIKGGKGDYYTQGRDGVAFPSTVIAIGGNLSAQWSVILRTYVAVGALNLTYSPTGQNSNSVAGTALRRAGLALPFSSKTAFAPGMFTRLPIS